MFDYSLKNSAAIGLMSLTALFGATSCSLPGLPGGAVTRAEKAKPAALGQCGDARVDLVQHDGINLLVFDGFHSSAVIQHDPNPENLSLPFKVTQIPANIDDHLYRVDYQGESYVFTDGFESGAVCKLQAK